VTGVDLDDGRRLDAPVVVNAAGAWAPTLAATAGIDLPVEPVMRTVHVVAHDEALGLGRVPSVFLPSGVYVLPERPTGSQVAWSTDDDPVGFDFTYRRAGFEDRVWPELVGTLRGYDRLKVTSGWCGLYAMNTLDHNAILGAWPGLDGAYVACGFSGHGFQHTPAMGRYLAELVVDAPVTLDLSRLSPQRILDGVPLREHAGRII
jgi:glycine/D-amino acid oxidase-like deaminating enzyme